MVVFIQAVLRKRATVTTAVSNLTPPLLRSASISGSSVATGGDVFLKGRYMEVGIHATGSFGTR